MAGDIRLAAANSRVNRKKANEAFKKKKKKPEHNVFSHTDLSLRLRKGVPVKIF